MADVVIYYEQIVREYQQCMAIKHELRRRGIKVKAYSIFTTGCIAKIFQKPKVVVFGNASMVAIGESDFRHIDDSLDTLRGSAPFLVNLQIEQQQPDDLAALGVSLDKEFENRIHNICWGERRKQQLLKLGIPESKLSVAGAVSLDFLKEEFRGMYRPKNELGRIYHIDSSKRWHLFVSSFTLADASAGQLMVNLKELRALQNSFIYQQVLTRKTSSAISRGIVLDWLDQYLQTHDDIVIYRPHPGEKVTGEMKALQQIYPDRFFWIGEESIQQWITACDVCNSWISTAIIESYMAKKTVNMCIPGPVPKDFFPPILVGCKTITTYEEFLHGQEEKPFDSDTFPISQEKIDYFYRIDDTFAYMHVCDVIEELLRTPPPEVPKSRFTLSRLKERWFIARLYRLFYITFRIPLSKIMPKGKRLLRSMEDSVKPGGSMRGALVLTKENRKKDRYIKKIVYQNAKAVPLANSFPQN